jgi:hypothetical protein
MKNQTFADKTLAPIGGTILFIIILCLAIPGFPGELWATLQCIFAMTQCLQVLP